MILVSRHGGEAQPLAPQRPVEQATVHALEPFLVELQERTFRYFWDTANPSNGLIPDRYPTPSFASIAAVGFGLTTYPIGVERGYITREEARQRLTTTCTAKVAPIRLEHPGERGRRLDPERPAL